ncbi:MAG TPA: hypothetical protein VFD84_13745 [Candidatus Binatia bacterium]|jgi:drug/metabolite transporter (DMT)-like permease|nr:hypothetical protein [Candidatus Binatia bacterium]
MTTWQGAATAVAILFGTHNVLVKRAAGRLPDAWGALVLELAAAATIALAITAMGAAGGAPPPPRDAGALGLVVLGGLFLGLGSVLYFTVFRLGGPLAVAVPWVLVGWVLVVTLLGVAVEGDRLGWRQLAGLVAAAVALWLLR